MTFLLSLEALVLELEGLAVLGNGAHNIVRYPVRDVGMNLQSNIYLRTEQTGEMLDDFRGNLRSVAVQSRRVELHAPVEASRLRGRYSSDCAASDPCGCLTSIRYRCSPHAGRAGHRSR